MRKRTSFESGDGEMLARMLVVGWGLRGVWCVMVYGGWMGNIARG